MALGGTATEDNGEIFSTADVVVIAVKPNDVAAALSAAQGKLKTDKTLVVSIAAGVTIAALEGWLPAGAKVVRVMPNTPCLVKEVRWRGLLMLLMFPASTCRAVWRWPCRRAAHTKSGWDGECPSPGDPSPCPSARVCC